MKTPKNPMQPFILDAAKRVRFRKNKIVDDLLEFASKHGMDLNTIASTEYTQDDRIQFAQLIGYSLWGFHALSYVSDRAAKAATEAAREQGFKQALGCRDGGCQVHCGVEEEGKQ